jgi:predicted transposase/invertase (TIGR01784 family)
MDYGFKNNNQIISRYALTEQETQELYGDQLWIYLCNLKAFNKKSLKGLSPQEAWLFILKNMINFAGTPEEMGERYSKVADAARMGPMPMDKQLEYVFAMLSEQEKLEIREAYYEDGYEDGMEKGEAKGKAEMAREMLNDGVPLDTIVKYSKLPKDEILSLR